MPIFTLLMSVIPLIPDLIKVGVTTFDAYKKIETIIREDRSLTQEERAQLEAAIAERKAVLDDTSRDVPVDPPPAGPPAGTIRPEDAVKKTE